MFDLENAISEWRQRMVAAGVKTDEILNELESHLRDDLTRQVKSGASTEEAFKLAARRIGESESLATEFDKSALGKEVQERKMKVVCIVSWR